LKQSRAQNCCFVLYLLDEGCIKLTRKQTLKTNFATVMIV